MLCEEVAEVTEIKDNAAVTKAVIEIPRKILKEFVDNNVSSGIMKKFHRVDQTNVFDNCYRINVWTTFRQVDRVVPTFNISASFLVELTDSGELVDITL